MTDPALSPLIYTFNGLDIALLVFCFLSAGVGVIRGVTREILSVGGWIGSIIGTVYLLPFVRPWVHSFIPSAMIADLVAGGVIFILLLTFFLVLSQTISFHVKHSVLGGLDRSLGLLFGLIRGGVLICLAYMVLAFFIPLEKQPEFLRTAKSVPWIQQGEKVLKSFIPRELIATSSTFSSSLEKTLPAQEDIEKAVEALSTLKPISKPNSP